jgi:hypothetical protein
MEKFEHLGENGAKVRVAGNTATMITSRVCDYLFTLEIRCSKAVSIKTNSNVPGIVNTMNQGKTLGSFNPPEPSTSNAMSNGPVTIRSLTKRC